MGRLTEEDVLRAALTRLQRRGGYTARTYFLEEGAPVADGEGADGGLGGLPAPGPHVGATCAIGGIEQAIYELTRKDVHSVRHRVARLFKLGSAPDRVESREERVYWRVMVRLNRLAATLFPGTESELGGIEGLSMNFSHDVGRRKVIRVIEAALDEVQRKRVRAA